jgi:hypothetical protein
MAAVVETPARAEAASINATQAWVVIGVRIVRLGNPR